MRLRLIVEPDPGHRGLSSVYFTMDWEFSNFFYLGSKLACTAHVDVAIIFLRSWNRRHVDDRLFGSQPA